MRREDSLEVGMLALPLLAVAVLSQELRTRFGEPPDLSIGQRIRLRIIEPAPPAAPTPFPHLLPAGRMRAVTIVGTLAAYAPYERLTVLRRGALEGLGPQTERTVDWIDVRTIEITQRRNGLNAVQGAAAGFATALGVGLTVGVFDSFFCSKGARCDRNGWVRTKQFARYAVPLGIVIGFFSPRWKRVYRAY